jgi:hypothetical protein
MPQVPFAASLAKNCRREKPESMRRFPLLAGAPRVMAQIP